jgi:hypothetical protein
MPQPSYPEFCTTIRSLAETVGQVSDLPLPDIRDAKAGLTPGRFHLQCLLEEKNGFSKSGLKLNHQF